MKISVVVAVYNIEAYIGKCISSILAQTYRDFELILVDDGSTDGSSELCDIYGQQDSRITVIHKDNGGLVSARKAGLEAAQGEYIGFVDGDDWIEPQMYEHLIALAEENKADMVLGGSTEDVGGQSINKINRFEPGVYDKERLQKEIYPHMLCVEDFFCMGIQPYIWNKLMRRDLAYAHIMTIDDRIRVGEDVAAVMPMLLMADKVVISDRCDYHYCIRGTSMMWSRVSEKREWEELWILHRFLQTTFSEHLLEDKINLQYQLRHYTVMNILTRAYGKIARRNEEGVLWPFGYRLSDRKCIVYSAGNFGRAVYGYLQTYYQNKVCLWVDREYRRYQAIGLPVSEVETIIREEDADILVAVLDAKVTAAIEENLCQLGVCRERIYCIDISENEVSDILSGACLA